MNKLQATLLDHVLALLAYTLGDGRAGDFFANSLHSLEGGEDAVPLSTKVGILQGYAGFLAKRGEHGTAAFYLEQALQCIGEVWKACVRYLNDGRLMQILAPAQIQFIACYAVLRSLASPEESYEKVLQFKALASLAGRERNRILHRAHFDGGLMERARELQDRIAALEAESVFRDVEVEYSRERAELRGLEAQFAKQFPKGEAFTDITWDKVQKAIPDNAVVVEYYYSALVYGLLQFEKDAGDPNMGFDVFITKKSGGVCQLVRLVIPDGEDAVDQADEFVEIL